LISFCLTITYADFKATLFESVKEALG